MLRLRILDYAIILLSLAVVSASVFWSSAGREGELRGEVEASGEVYIMPLTQNGSLVLEGPVGETRVEVADGEIFITDSDCRDKICIAMGRISGHSGWIACLPNRVFVRVVAVNPEVDAGAF